MIFPRSWPENGNICALGCVLDAAQDTVWGISWSHPAWRRLWLRREPLAAAKGDGEPRPGREQGKGLRLGHWESSPSTVCAKGLGEALATQQGGLGTTAPPLQTPGPKAPPSYLLCRQACAGICQLLPQPVCQGCREHGDHLPIIPPLTLLLQLVYFSKINFIFLRRGYLHGSKQKYSEKAIF